MDIGGLWGSSPNSYGPRALRPNDTAATFAHEIISRARRTSALGPVPVIQPTAPESGEVVTPTSSVAPSTAVSPKNSTDTAGNAKSTDADALSGRLESALAGTVGYMTDKYGDKAGTAMMGLMAKSLGDGEVDEASFSKALLQVVKFVDQNFGTDEGDALIKHLNGSLNDSINAFFDNGKDELFMVKTTPISAGGTVGAANASVTTGLASFSGTQNADAPADMADGILAILNSYAAQRKKKLPQNPYEQNTPLPTGVMVNAAA